VVDPELITVKSNAGNAASAMPSETRIVTPRYVPTCASDGVPVNRPLAESNTAHTGFASMLNVNESPSGSAAVGVKA
jgi:hypothetical protein